VTDTEARAALRRAAAHVLVADVDVPVLDEPSAHHVFRVLRVRDGETVTVTDGAGRWRACTARGGELEVTGDVATVDRPEPRTVAFAMPKADRPEWVVQKLTELGIDRIVLLHAERSVVRWDVERAGKHVAKLHRVAAEALQQSRGLWLPEIVGPVPAAEVLAELPVAEPGGRPLSAEDRGVAIGPEGGWSEGELAAAGDAVGLGVSVLRVETAALAAAARLVAARV
jgi:16S rRNA (uracil1498-N3)-methyltransferase